MEEEDCVEGSERCTNVRKEAKSLLDTGGNDWKPRG